MTSVSPAGAGAAPAGDSQAGDGDVPDGIDVPVGIDRDGLERELGARLGARPAGSLQIGLVSGGKSNLTYRLRWGGERYILRRPPLGEYNPRNHDVAREFRLIDALAPTGVPLPRATFLCTDTAVLGVPFYVMSLVEGRVLREAADAPDMADPGRLARLGEALVDGLVALHSVVPESVGLGDLGKADRYVRRQVERWSTQWESTQERPIPALDEIGRRLRAALDLGAIDPVPARPYVIHGDYNVGNVIVSDADRFDREPPLRAVLDWEMATLGHPLMDLGVLATYNGPHADRILETDRHVSTLPGFPTVDRLVASYADRSGSDVSAFPFFHVLAFFKVLILTEDVRSRFRRGDTAGEGFELMGRSVPAMAEALVDIADRSELPGLAGAGSPPR